MSLVGRLLRPATQRAFFVQKSSYVARPRVSIKGRWKGESVKGKAEEFVSKPASETSFNLGKAAVAGGAALGLGALCFYGLGGSQELGTVDRAIAWPEYVRQRVQSTYAYFGASIGVSAAAAVATFRSPAMLRLVSRGGWMPMIGGLVALVGSGMVCQSIPYPEHGFGSKHIAWLVHTGILGVIVAPMCLMGGPIITRAALYTAGVVGSLSALAICAPSEKFLTMGGPLAMGLGVVVVSSLGSMFLSPASALGAGLYSISLYGGLLVFSGFLLYDTQKIIKRAEEHPPPNTFLAVAPYDPINNSIGIYLDTMNIFIRIAVILSGGGGKRR